MNRLVIFCLILIIIISLLCTCIKSKKKEHFVFGKLLKQNKEIFKNVQNVQNVVEHNKETIENTKEDIINDDKQFQDDKCELINTSGFTNEHQILSENNLDNSNVEFKSPVLLENDNENTLLFGRVTHKHEPIFKGPIKMNENVDIQKTMMLNSEAKMCVGNTCLVKHSIDNNYTIDNHIDMSNIKSALNKLKYIKDRETSYLTRSLDDYETTIKYPSDFSNKTQCGALLWNTIKKGNDVKENSFCNTCCKPKYIKPFEQKRAQAVVLIHKSDISFKLEVNNYDKPYITIDMFSNSVYKNKGSDFNFKIFLSRTHRNINCRLLLTNDIKKTEAFIKSKFDSNNNFGDKMFSSKSENNWCTNSFSTMSPTSNGYCIPSTHQVNNNIKYRYICLKYN